MQTEPATEQASRVRELLAELAPDPSAELSGPLADAGFDSLAYAELSLAIEERLGVRLADADVRRLSTADEIVRAVARLRSPARSGRVPEGIGKYQAAAGRVLSPILNRWYQVRITGRDAVPRTGPAIVCANHNSLLDIPFLTMALPRPIWFMAKTELFRGVGRPFFHALGGFPVERQINDLNAVDVALAVIDSGTLLGMFPEGTRSPDRLLPFLPGAAWIALVRGVPLVPVAITGAAESLPRGRVIPKRTRVSVSFGRRIDVEREADPRRRAARAREVTAELRTRIEALLAGSPPA